MNNLPKKENDIVKKQRGSVTIEATIALTAFLFAFMMLYNVVTLCRAQSKIGTAINCAAKEISQYSYIYGLTGLNDSNKNLSNAAAGTKEQIDNLATDISDSFDAMQEIGNNAGNAINTAVNGNPTSPDTWNSVIDSVQKTSDSVDLASVHVKSIQQDIEEMAENPKDLIFGLAKIMATDTLEIGKSRLIAAPIARTLSKKHLKRAPGDDPNACLKALGVAKGSDSTGNGSYLHGLDFSNSLLFPKGSDDIVIIVKYKLKLFEFLPIDIEFDITQSASTKGWLNGDGGKIIHTVSGADGSDDQSKPGNPPSGTDKPSDDDNIEPDNPSPSPSPSVSPSPSPGGGGIGPIITEDDETKKLLDELVNKYGKDVETLYNKYGKDVLNIIKEHGKDAINIIKDYGQDAITVINEHGDSAFSLIKKYGGDAVRTIRDYGQDGIKAINCCKGDYLELFEVIGKYNKDAIDIINKYGYDGFLYLYVYGKDAVEKYKNLSPDEFAKYIENETLNNNTITVNENSLNHSTKGDFTYDPKTGKISKMKGGGHGQSNINFLKENGMSYNIEKTYSNGVRIGNVPDHKDKSKRSGTGQAWFPETWSDTDIKNAGEFVSNLLINKNAVDGEIVFGEYKGVRVGIIKTNGQIGTIFPDANMQPGG